MIGIYFKSHAPVKTIMNLMLSLEGMQKYTWMVADYWLFSVGNGIEAGTYTYQELTNALSNMTDDEHAEQLVLYAANSPALLHECDTWEDYVKGSCELAFVCCDANEFELYCKDANMLHQFYQLLLHSDIYMNETIETMDATEVTRTGF